MILFYGIVLIIFIVVCIFREICSEQKANNLFNQARQLENNSEKNPHNINNLIKALEIYQKCNKLKNRYKFAEAAHQCQIKIDNCRLFLKLIASGKQQAKQNFFKEALVCFVKAKRLFITQELTRQISKCQQKIKEQTEYEQALKNSLQKAKQGYFQEALNLIEPALKVFPRHDGQQLLAQL